MESKQHSEHKEKGRRMILPIVLILSVIAGLVWYQSTNQSNKTTLPITETQEGHKNDEAHEDGTQDKTGHDDHDEGKTAHGEHDDHDAEQVIRLSEAEMTEFGIKVATADGGRLHRTVSLPGEVRANGDRLAHLVPRVPGVVLKVFKRLGDRVKKGEVMAILDSRELSDTKAAFLAASERVWLAKANFDREASLRKKQISSEQEYLEAKRALAEANIERRSAEQKLHALGFSDRYLKDLPNHPEESFTQYQIAAPFSGTVIEKHITLGEALKDDSDAFVIVDLSSVWVDLSVYQKDLDVVSEGQSVVIEATQGDLKTEGKISTLGPVVGEATRTALARIVLSNEGGQWRPGLFVNARVAVGEIISDLIVPKSAIQKIKDQNTLFVMADGALKAQPVKLGRSDEHHVEITEGIHWGDLYVSEGGFTLRAQLSVGELGDGHNH